MTTFGQRFKQLRLDKKKTQKELADNFFLNYTSISKYENDKAIPEHSLLASIADYFNVSVDYLLCRTDSPNSNYHEETSEFSNANIFGDRLKTLREEKGLQQKELADILNVHRGSISNWEQDKRTPDKDMLVKIADYFNISIDYLFGRTDDPNNIVYSATIDGDKIDLEFDKDYPHKLTPKEVEELIRRLRESRFDVDGLIEEIQNEEK